MKRFRVTLQFDVEGPNRDEIHLPLELATLIVSPLAIPGSGSVTVTEVERPLLDKLLDASRMNP